MIAPFHVGQRVVAIKNHSQGAFKKGDEFIVFDIVGGCCEYLVYVGINTEASLVRCNLCNKVKRKDKELYFSHRLFAPIQEISNETFESIEQWITEQEAIEI